MMTKKPLLGVIGMAVLGVNALALSGLVCAQSSSGEAESIEEVTVTGSRIQKSNLVSSSPVTQIDAEELKFKGTTRIEDLINDLPQTMTSNSSGDANGATGTATVDLRGLEPERTLVLVDGRRLPAGSPIATGIGSDLNQIPGAMVKRVEVLTGGASAAYGSDAVAGVVNFIMVDDFEGVSIDYQNSFYHHDNNNKSMKGYLDAAGFDTPKGGVSDGDINDISFVIGANLDDGRGNVTAYVSYRKIKAVLQADRDYSACSLKDGPGTFSCGGSGTIPTGRFTDFGSLSGQIGGVASTGYDFTVSGNDFVDSNGLLYNFGPLNYYQRPDERYTGGVFGHYEINERVEAYTQLMFMDDRTRAQIAPSGNFFVTDNLNCNNPLLSDQQVAAICTAYGLGPTGNIRDITVTKTDENGIVITDPITGLPVTGQGKLFIGRRNVEGGPRADDIRHTSFRGVFGIRGDINDNWSYDLYGQYSEVSLEQTYFNDLSTTRIKRALNVVIDDREISPGVPVDPLTFDQPICQSVIDGSDPNCVPWNIFKTGGVTPEAIAYLRLPLFARGGTEQKVFSGYVAGDLTDYGVKLPSAETGVSVVFGLEYRSENLEYNPDQGYTSGDAAGQGGPTLGVKGSLDVKEFFTEVSIPLVEGKAFAESITLDLAYRYSDYSTDIDTDTFKVATSWTPTTDLKLRASFQRAVRHANIRELFRPQSLGLFDMDVDPCAGPLTGGKTKAGRTFAECARSGVTAGQFGNIVNSPAGQYNHITGGVAELKPEESDTVSAGFIYSPSFVDGLTLSIDYFDIDVSEAIADIGAEFILNECLETGASQFCNLIKRGSSTGTLWLADDAITNIDVNIGFFNVTGYDLTLDYELDVGDFGSINFADTATFLSKWDKQNVPSAPVLDCVGNWGGSCEAPKPDLVNSLRATWFTPWDLSVSASWRYISSVDDLGTHKANFDAINYFDLASIWSVTERSTVRLGINNVMDKEPPLTADAGGSIFGNGNTFPGIYDALGRYIFLGLSTEF